MRASRRRHWAEGKYEHLRKPRPNAEDREANRALKAQRNREAALRQWAEGRGNVAGILSPAARRKSGETLKVSARAREHRAFVYKLRKARARARRVSVSKIFDEGTISELIVRWQRTGDGQLLAAIVRGCLPLIESAIARFSPTSAAEFPEVRSELILKLVSILPRYDVARAKSFSFFLTCLRNYLISRFHATVKRRSREVLTDFSAFEFEDIGAVDPPQIRPENEEFEARLRDLLRRPSGWQWRWRWQRKGELPLPAWQREWQWKLAGTIAA